MTDSAHHRPEVSIVTPVYNRAQTVGRAVQSVIDQTFSKWEMILVDDFSTDESREIIRNFAARDQRIRLIESENNFGGPARPRNIGIRCARAEYIALLDSDDWWYPSKLEESLEYIGRADVIYHDLDMYAPEGKKQSKKAKGRTLTSPAFSDLMTGGNAIPNSSVVAKRHTILDAGGFSEEQALASVEDFDLWLRIGRTNARFWYIGKSLGAYRRGEGISWSVERHIQAVQAVYNLHLDMLGKREQRRAEAAKSYYMGRNRLNAGNPNGAQGLFKICLKSGQARCRVKALFSLAQITCRRLWQRRMKGLGAQGA